MVVEQERLNHDLELVLCPVTTEIYSNVCLVLPNNQNSSEPFIICSHLRNNEGTANLSKIYMSLHSNHYQLNTNKCNITITRTKYVCAG